MDRRGLILWALAVGAALRAAPLPDAINHLGLELYARQCSHQPAANLALSPYGIESGLGLVYAGASGATRAELSSVLGLPAEAAEAQAQFAALRTGLAEAAARGGAAWLVANRLFGQQGLAFYPDFITALATGYAAPFQALDFAHAAPAAVNTINRWIGRQTSGRIRDLIAPDALGDTTRLVAVNALYLKIRWAEPFKTEATRPLPFYRGGKALAAVPTMARTFLTNYWKQPGFTAVTVPYAAGSSLQFLILLPDERGGLANLTSQLTAATLREFAHAQLDRGSRVSLYLPKFRLAGKTRALGADLRELGLRSTFDEPKGSADFSRMAPRTPEQYLFLSELYHQAVIEVNEAGTEAAAATGAGMAVPAVMRRGQPIEVRVDHPFFFAIQDELTGLCLFLGSVSDPGEAGG